MWLLPALCALSLRAAADPWQSALASRDDQAPAILDRSERSLYLALVSDLALAARRPADSGPLPADLEMRAASMGFHLSVTTDRLELRPLADPVGAAGVLVLRRGALPAELVLAAPHPFDDLRTGAILSLVFEHAPVRALFIATQSRNASPGADPAHNTLSTLQLAMGALDEALVHPLFVQLHGFAATTAAADGVIAGGSAGTAPDLLDRSAELLDEALQGAEIVSARWVPRLAALGNVQGQSLRGRGRFIHIELAAWPRRALAQDPAACGRLGEGLVAMALSLSTFELSDLEESPA